MCSQSKGSGRLQLLWVAAVLLLLHTVTATNNNAAASLSVAANPSQAAEVTTPMNPLVTVAQVNRPRRAPRRPRRQGLGLRRAPAREVVVTTSMEEEPVGRWRRGPWARRQKYVQDYQTDGMTSEQEQQLVVSDNASFLSEAPSTDKQPAKAPSSASSKDAQTAAASSTTTNTQPAAKANSGSTGSAGSTKAPAAHTKSGAAASKAKEEQQQQQQQQQQVEQEGEADMEGELDVDEQAELSAADEAAVSEADEDNDGSQDDVAAAAAPAAEQDLDDASAETSSDGAAAGSGSASKSSSSSQQPAKQTPGKATTVSAPKVPKWDVKEQPNFGSDAAQEEEDNEAEVEADNMQEEDSDLFDDLDSGDDASVAGEQGSSKTGTTSSRSHSTKQGTHTKASASSSKHTATHSSNHKAKAASKKSTSAAVNGTSTGAASSSAGDSLQAADSSMPSTLTGRSKTIFLPTPTQGSDADDSGNSAAVTAAPNAAAALSAVTVAAAAKQTSSSSNSLPIAGNQHNKATHPTPVAISASFAASVKASSNQQRTTGAQLEGDDGMVLLDGSDAGPGEDDSSDSNIFPAVAPDYDATANVMGLNHNKGSSSGSGSSTGRRSVGVATLLNTANPGGQAQQVFGGASAGLLRTTMDHVALMRDAILKLAAKPNLLQSIQQKQIRQVVDTLDATDVAEMSAVPGLLGFPKIYRAGDDADSQLYAKKTALAVAMTLFSHMTADQAVMMAGMLIPGYVTPGLTFEELNKRLYEASISTQLDALFDEVMAGSSSSSTNQAGSKDSTAGGAPTIDGKPASHTVNVAKSSKVAGFLVLALVLQARALLCGF